MLQPQALAKQGWSERNVRRRDHRHMPLAVSDLRQRRHQQAQLADAIAHRHQLDDGARLPAAARQHRIETGRAAGFDARRRTFAAVTTQPRQLLQRFGTDKTDLISLP